MEESQILQAWRSKMAINIQQPNWDSDVIYWKKCSEGAGVGSENCSFMVHPQRHRVTIWALQHPWCCATPIDLQWDPHTLSFKCRQKVSSSLKFLTLSLVPACKKRQELLDQPPLLLPGLGLAVPKKKGKIPMYPFFLLCHYLTFRPNL